MPRLKLDHPLLLLLTFCFFLAVPSGADWLITLEGKLIETQGPWTVEGKTLTYTDAEGEKHQVAVAEVDLEASEETTAIKAGKTYVPKPKAEPEAAEAKAAEPKATEPKLAKSEPDVILYMTSWCGYCRRTSKLLKSLDVAFVAKDIEKDRAAAQEYRKKAGGYRGIPVLDFEGRIIRGYQAELIHKLATQRKQNNAAAE